MRPIQTRIVHLLGNTGSGKTTFMDALVNEHPDQVVGISVGRELMKRYPPEYFQGQATPTVTEVEAIQLYQEFVERWIYAGMRLILVDGQPRKPSQVLPVHHCAATTWHDYVLFHVDHDVRAERLANRVKPGSSRELDMARLVGDYRSQYETMVELAKHGIELNIFDVTTLDLQQMLDKFVDHYRL